MITDPNQEKITEEQFRPVTVEEEEKEEIATEAISFGRDAWRRLVKNKAAFISALIILFIAIMAFVGPHMNKFTYKEQDIKASNVPPKVGVLENINWLPFNGVNSDDVDLYEQRQLEENYWFGADKLGRDIWTRTWKGTQISLIIGIVATLVDLLIGVIYGGVSGYFGGNVDNVMQRIVEVLLGIPQLVIIILLIMVFQPGLFAIILAIALTGWIGQSRIVRGQILKIKTSEYILAARTLGAKPRRLIGKHLLPNTLGQIIITTMFSIPSAIFAEAFLSFIGLGIPPPQASLGTLIDSGSKVVDTHAYQVFFPALVLSLLLICFNLFADGLRDAFDPKMRR